MIVRINGSVLQPIHPLISNIPDKIMVNQWIEIGKKIDKAFKKYVIPSSIVLTIMNIVTPVLAATTELTVPASAPVGTSNLIVALWPIITMVQDLALPVGIIVSIWGMIEMIIGSPGWKQKLKFAIIGYISMFIIPTFFVAIHNAFSSIPIIIPK